MQDSVRPAELVPLGVGYYTVPEAARLLHTRPRNIQRWLGGYSHRRKNGERAHEVPLWRPELPRFGDHIELGFRDLIELRFVAAFLKHNVGLGVIRRCLENARNIVGDERPFATGRFRTDGRSIFLESLTEGADTDGGPASVLDLKTGQLVFREVIEATFRDLDLEEGSVVRWRPYRGKASIVIDPARSFGKPLVAAHGVPTAALAAAVEAENSVPRVARLYGVPAAEVHDAVAFERSLAA